MTEDDILVKNLKKNPYYIREMREFLRQVFENGTTPEEILKRIKESKFKIKPFRQQKLL